MSDAARIGLEGGRIDEGRKMKDSKRRQSVASIDCSMEALHRGENSSGTVSGRAARSPLIRLAKLEHFILGSRMPDPKVLILGSGWQPDPLGYACLRCGVTVSPYERSEEGCGECRRRPSHVCATVRLGRYAPPLSQWVPAVKSRCWKSMARELGQALANQVLAAVDERRMSMPDAVVPIPVHWSRALLRGIDHTAEISEALAERLDRPVQRLLSARLAVRQAGSRRSERLANRGASGQGRFEMRRPTLGERSLGWLVRRGLLPRLPPKLLPSIHSAWASSSTASVEPHCHKAGFHSLGSLLLVDDVRTTGASSESAAECLIRAGARSVSLAVCAVADPPRRSGLRRRVR